MDQKARILSTIDAMTNAFHKGDVDGIMRTYEPGAVVVGEPGATVSGTPALRAMFAGFIAAKAHFTFLGHEVIQADDIALHLTPWQMAGVAPDGTAVTASGLSVAVLRRQPDGRWLMVIDDPYGDALLDPEGGAVEGDLMDEAPTLEVLARRAVDGDRDAVATIVRELQANMYALALRTLWHPQDAEDATQEILVRVVTRLSQFDFKSRLRTWAYRVATNYLLDVKKSCVERQKLSFTSFAEDLADGSSADGPGDHEHSVLTEEVKIGCTLGMLQCLDRPHRLAYVLGEILDLPAPEAADALDLEPAAFRKRLQRAREAIEDFTRSHCGLVSEAAACACNRRVPAAVQRGRLQANEPHFAKTGSSFAEARELIRGIEEAKRVVELHRGSRPGGATLDFTRRVVSALDAFSS